MKNIDIRTKKEIFAIREVGKELLKIEINGLEISENEEKDGKVARISDFYSEIVNNCKKYAEEVLFKKIKNEYAEKGSSGERRGFKKYLYKIEACARVEDGALSVFIDVSLSRAGVTIKKRNFYHRWDVDRGIMEPQYNRKKRSKKEGQTT